MPRYAVRILVASLALSIAMASPCAAQPVAEMRLAESASAATCDMPVPMPSAVGLNWYADSKASIIDPVKRAQHDEMERPLNTFMDIVVPPADDAWLGKLDPKALDCADRNLENWAGAGGLLQKPTTNAALADQTIAIFGLNIMALKRREAGIPVSPEVRLWLHDITRKLVVIYTQGGPRNNMYVWSGAAAAAGNLLQRDSVLDRHAGRVWRAAIAKVDGRGHIASELGRGQRALIYHQYFNSALGALNLTRLAAGHRTGRDGQAAMTRLSNAVGDWACDPAQLEDLTGVAQEPFSRWNRVMGYAFNANYLTARWKQCVKNVPAFSDSSYGGRFDLTAMAISS